MAVLPKEVMNWLQSLGLSGEIKTPKWDLHNGLLVGEILSKYFPRAVNLNSFRNCCSLKHKIANWNLIKMVIKNKQLAVPMLHLDGTMLCKEGKAHFLLNSLYAALCHKRPAQVLQPKAQMGKSDPIAEKLRFELTVLLPNPSELTGTSDISCLPFFTVMDVLSYLTAKNVGFSTLRDYQKSEGYTLMVKGHVDKVECIEFTQEGFFAIKACVKSLQTTGKESWTAGGRDSHVYTRKKGHRIGTEGRSCSYPWVILTSVGADKGSCILSAFCTCNQGIDGVCQHVQATLYEVIDFRDSRQKRVATSSSWEWVRRSEEIAGLEKLSQAKGRNSSYCNKKNLLPSYARGTAASAVNSNLTVSELLLNQDLLTNALKAEKIIRAHKNQQQHRMQQHPTMDKKHVRWELRTPVGVASGCASMTL